VTHCTHRSPCLSKCFNAKNQSLCCRKSCNMPGLFTGFFHILRHKSPSLLLHKCWHLLDIFTGSFPYQSVFGELIASYLCSPSLIQVHSTCWSVSDLQTQTFFFLFFCFVFFRFHPPISHMSMCILLAPSLPADHRMVFYLCLLFIFPQTNPSLLDGVIGNPIAVIVCCLCCLFDIITFLGKVSCLALNARLCGIFFFFLSRFGVFSTLRLATTSLN